MIVRLRKLSRGINDISHVVVNFKQPVQGRQTSYVYELTTIVHMDGENVVVTETGDLLEGTLNNMLDVLERQVRKQRDKRRSS